MPGVADEMLAAVENEVVALTHGAGLDRIGIGTGTRFGQGEAVDFLALDARQQVVVDLVAGAGHEDFRRPCDEHVQRPGDLGQLTLDQRLGQVVQATTAHFFGHVEGVEAGGDRLAANLRRQLRGHLVGAVDLLFIGQQFLLDEAAYRVHQHFLFLGQLEIHAATCCSCTERSVGINDRRNVPGVFPWRRAGLRCRPRCDRRAGRRRVRLAVVPPGCDRRLRA
ncbi:hypothetical protein D3C78_1100110 [compost metagenome]